MVKTESQNLIFIPNFYQVTEIKMYNYACDQSGIMKTLKFFLNATYLDLVVNF